MIAKVNFQIGKTLNVISYFCSETFREKCSELYFSRFCIRGNHRGDISLTERSVSLLKQRCSNLVQLGDCFTWSLSGIVDDEFPTHLLNPMVFHENYSTLWIEVLCILTVAKRQSEDLKKKSSWTSLGQSPRVWPHRAGSRGF